MRRTGPDPGSPGEGYDGDHTGTQHTFINEDTYLQSAEVLLGLRKDSPFL